MNRKKFRIKPLQAFGLHFKLGLTCALAMVLLSFSWTDYDDQAYVEWGGLDQIEELFPDIPLTEHKPPPPPPPPPPIIEEVPVEELIDEEPPKFVDESVEEDDIVEEPIYEEEAAEIPEAPSAAPEEDEIDELVYVPESMPRFPGCEGLDDTRKEKEACAKKKMLEYIYSKLNYPTWAMENGIEGTCVIQFVVTKDGSVDDIEIVRDIGGGCGKAAYKVVADMSGLPEKWTPGKQRGRNVKVKYTLPIKFKLVK